MSEYYFDIETYSTTPEPDTINDKIITIQYQRVKTETGEPRGDLEILTEWDCGSEKELLAKFKDIFFTENDFDFIPIGENLYGFDLVSLANRSNKYFKPRIDLQFFRERPIIDIKTILVMMNNGSFKGYSNILGKKQQGKIIKELYEKNEKDKIIQYIKDEAENFLQKYQILKKELPKIQF